MALDDRKRMILQSIDREGKKDISFTITKNHLNEAIELLSAEKEALCYEDISHREDISKVSIVGAGMTNNPGVAAKMFEALFEADINIHMISRNKDFRPCECCKCRKGSSGNSRQVSYLMRRNKKAV